VAIDILQDILAFLVVLTVLVFVHELGHYWIARRNGVAVEVFSIGFGPELFGWTAKSGTRWRVSALPLGGYVKMLGDMDASSRPDDEKLSHLDETQKANAFPMKSLGARAAIVAAGPLANFLFAWIVIAALLMTVGQPTTAPVVAKVLPDTAAAEAGLAAGDRIAAINGSAVDRFEDIQRLVQLNLDSPLAMEVERDGRAVTLDATPQIVTTQDADGCPVRIARLGIQADGGREFKEFGFFDALASGATQTVGMAVDTLSAVWQIIEGRRTTDELGGPIRIAEMSGQVAEIGIISLLWFMALLSVNLGLINLFPVPMLDGGHLVFYGYEWLRGRPLTPRLQDVCFKMGLALVLGLMLFVTINDILRIDGCASISG